MGGSAFSSGAYSLSTPRMPPRVYSVIRERCHALLRELFLCVATPIEGPEKRDFGDIDLMVALEKRMVFPSTPADQADRPPIETLKVVQTVLGAEFAIFEPAGNAANMAIPWPEDLLETAYASTEVTSSLHGTTDNSASIQEVEPDGDRRHQKQAHLSSLSYVQVDVRICSSSDELQWLLFKHAHGDFWNIVGTSIRPLGLTLDERALWLRIPEIEAANRKRSRIYLCDDPATVLSFLGFDPSSRVWEEPFAALEDLFDYVTTSKWFAVPPESWWDDEPSSQNVEGAANGRIKKLKSNDRRRMKHRPGFRAWIEDYLPKLRKSGKFPCRSASLPLVQQPVDHEVLVGLMTDSQNTTVTSLTPNNEGCSTSDATSEAPTPRSHGQMLRSIVREAAFVRFGPTVRAEYAERLHHWMVETQRDLIRREIIRSAVSIDNYSPAFRACAIRALRRVVLEEPQISITAGEDNKALRPFTTLAAAKGIRLSDGLYDVQATREFVNSTWENIAKVAWDIHLDKENSKRLRSPIKRGPDHLYWKD
ncbi:hypothetical protein VTK73DRAFT_360 [Phialemonium thermophilum]|uniref:Uncharacterized protein n=1 Tax=Phialemonium thermophilum TaxID=223376 RepID=A0ABR3XF90_9PEZI